MQLLEEPASWLALPSRKEVSRGGVKFEPYVLEDESDGLDGSQVT